MEIFIKKFKCDSYSRKKIDKIDWDFLSINPNATHILEKYKEKINDAIELLRKNPDKINWIALSRNPSIFELDYTLIDKRINIIKEQMMMKMFHPCNIDKFSGWGFDNEMW